MVTKSVYGRGGVGWDGLGVGGGGGGVDFIPLSLDPNDSSW